MNILMISDQYPPIIGGYERQAERLARALARRSHSVSVVTGHWDATSPARELVDGVEVFRLQTLQALLRMRGTRRFCQDVYAFNLSRWLRGNLDRFDVIHAHSIRRGAAVALQQNPRRTKPVLVKEPNSGPKNTFRELEFEYRGKAMRELFLRELRHVAVLNEAAEREYAAEPFASLTIHRAFNGIELAGMPGYEPADPPRILALSRLRPEKNHLLLLEAFAVVAPEFPHWRLRICGDGPELGRIRNRIGQLDLSERIELPGPTREPLKEIAAAALLVSVSIAEGMSNTLLEALAVGTPAVATTVGANAEMLKDDAGWLVPSDDLDALVAALRKAMGDPGERDRRSRMARVRAESFSIEAAAEHYESIYRTMGARP